MANLHRGMCLDCVGLRQEVEAYRAGVRTALGVIADLAEVARRAGASQEELLALLAKAPPHRIDEFLDRSLHERPTRPDLDEASVAT